MTRQIAVVPGDGIGQEVVPVAVDVLNAVGEFEFVHADAGDAVAAETGTPLPEETYETVATADATLFGAAGETAADVVLPLREAVNSFANVRPARAYPGAHPLHPETDLVFVRENTEGVYSGIESEITEGVSTLTRVVTTDASRAIAEFGYTYANEHGYDDVTIAHKANVMRETDGRFLDACRDVARERDDVDAAAVDDALMDALATALVQRPEAYGVVVCPNLAGDVLSDLAAGLVGGLGLLPSANVGHDNGLFEPVHGSAPDIAGDGIANPTAAVLSAAMCLEHLGNDHAASRVRDAAESALENGPHTPDLDGTASTTDVRDAIVDAL